MKAPRVASSKRRRRFSEFSKASSGNQTPGSTFNNLTSGRSARQGNARRGLFAMRLSPIQPMRLLRADGYGALPARKVQARYDANFRPAAAFEVLNMFQKPSGGRRSQRRAGNQDWFPRYFHRTFDLNSRKS